MSKKLTGIDRAVIAAGGQKELARMLSEASGRTVHFRSVTYWKQQGYVSMPYIRYVSRLTGVPIEDLIDEAR